MQRNIASELPSNVRLTSDSTARASDMHIDIMACSKCAHFPCTMIWTCKTPSASPTHLTLTLSVPHSMLGKEFRACAADMYNHGVPIPPPSLSTAFHGDLGARLIRCKHTHGNNLDVRRPGR